MVVGEVDVQFSDALVARLVSCALYDDRVGLRGGNTHVLFDSTHVHFDSKDVSDLGYVDRVSRSYGSYVDG